MQAHPLRLAPGDDLRITLTEALRQLGLDAAFVIQGIGSLSVAQLRFAGADAPTELRGDLEILTLAGSISPDGAHLHMSVSDSRGQVFGGHVAAGCIVRTTAELLLALLPAHRFTREHDTATGFMELVIRHAPDRT
ncbi:PPC domain-containing DNA-binding protein [Paraburkholderia sp. DHOC27]|uniref:PPC domain-containing DNA-binding protein n=1 Tax=Paraburkholderia sp. DHOC27 TaxID=2303330 RepID=UPI000E3BD33F|nr:PPC domain-containing DNA-binding protein [Paraburkholderia sp. DHOC27]RFU45168.1 DNA-binding protein [Paraburkholderia sp. DHOC27]